MEREGKEIREGKAEDGKGRERKRKQMKGKERGRKRKEKERECKGKENINNETLKLMKQNAHGSKAVILNLNSTLTNVKRYEESINNNTNNLF